MTAYLSTVAAYNQLTVFVRPLLVQMTNAAEGRGAAWGTEMQRRISQFITEGLIPEIQRFQTSVVGLHTNAVTRAGFTEDQVRHLQQLAPVGGQGPIRNYTEALRDLDRSISSVILRGEARTFFYNADNDPTRLAPLVLTTANPNEFWSAICNQLDHADWARL